MTDFLSSLAAATRLLARANLRPVQSDRFQPTGFPDLGPANYTLPDGTEMILVESAQSMANRAEAVCWDEAAGKLVADLNGLPYVRVQIMDGKDEVATTASILEAHRLNSPYVLQGAIGGRTFEEAFLERAAFKRGRPVDRARFLAAVFHYDPSSLLHGLFMSNVEDGRMRLPRVMSSFIEARNVRPAHSGGVKNDRVNASGDTEAGFGNVPFARTEFTAESITCFLNVDLRQLRSFGLPAECTGLLQGLALYKFRRVLRDGLRLRTACDLEVKDVLVEAPAGLEMPDLSTLEREVARAIGACSKHFADPAVTDIAFQTTAESSKASRKAVKEKKEREKKS